MVSVIAIVCLTIVAEIAIVVLGAVCLVIGSLLLGQGPSADWDL